MEDREQARLAREARFISHVVDDGWNLPTEVVEEITLRVIEAYDDALLTVRIENMNHKGRWLTMEAAKKYEMKSWVWRCIYENQYIGKLAEIRRELMENYGVTELEAVNILNGRNVKDYVAKYDRIRNMIPVGVNVEQIVNEVRREYAC